MNHQKHQTIKTFAGKIFTEIMQLIAPQSKTVEELYSVFQPILGLIATSCVDARINERRDQSNIRKDPLMLKVYEFAKQESKTAYEFEEVIGVIIMFLAFLMQSKYTESILKGGVENEQS